MNEEFDKWLKETGYDVYLQGKDNDVRELMANAWAAGQEYIKKQLGYEES